MKITPLGDSAVLIEVGDDAAKVRSLASGLEAKKHAGVFDIVPAYTTVAVYYNPVEWARSGPAKPHEAISAWILDAAKTIAIAKPLPRDERIIPVCYGGEYGPDLAEFAAGKGLTTDEVIRIHSGASYEVRAIGFSPGFPYLAGLPETLHMPRKSSPRTSVPPGSVGIGGTQTGVYTLATPGGWHLLGRTPLRLFRPEETAPAWLKVGDSVRFDPITSGQFEKVTG
ncbi:MAG: 5-oxoprolinase subunit PxpB [Nibricoccus sp.]